MASKPTNPRIDALVKPLFDKALEDAAAAAEATATMKAAAAVAEVFLGSGASLPTGKTAVVGQIFIRTGATAPGLYVCTASTSSASTWKAVSYSNS